MGPLEQLLRPEEKINLILRGIYGQKGYENYRMNRFEEAAFYLENKSFLGSDRFITFEDANGRLMALKPDVTLSIVKNTRATREKSEKLWYSEHIFRFSGRAEGYKELQQTGLEYVGAVGTDETAEVLSLACESMKVLSDSWVICLSHMGFVTALLRAWGIDSSLFGQIFSCLKAKSQHDLENLPLAKEQKEKLKALCSCDGPIEEALDRAKNLSCSKESDEAVNELQQLVAAMNEEERNHLLLDFSVLSDTAYYTGILFEGFARQVAGPVLVGGRYDNLLRKLGKENLQGIGFAVNFWELEHVIGKNTSVREEEA